MTVVDDSYGHALDGPKHGGWLEVRDWCWEVVIEGPTPT